MSSEIVFVAIGIPPLVLLLLKISKSKSFDDNVHVCLKLTPEVTTIGAVQLPVLGNNVAVDGKLLPVMVNDVGTPTVASFGVMSPTNGMATAGIGTIIGVVGVSIWTSSDIFCVKITIPLLILLLVRISK